MSSESDSKPTSLDICPKAEGQDSCLIHKRTYLGAKLPIAYHTKSGAKKTMAKKCFLSFYYKPDNWRVQQVRNIGSIDKQPLLTANKWEEIKEKGDQAVKDWIESNLRGKECLVVLVGEKTADRPWVKYEIKEAWKKGMGVTAVYIHGLKNSDGEQGKKGKNPFDGLSVNGETITGAAHDTPYSSSTYVYDHIKDNIESWVADAVKARK